jgi:hypothetical protein
MATGTFQSIGIASPLSGSITPVDQTSTSTPSVGIVSPAMRQNPDGTWNYGTPQPATGSSLANSTQLPSNWQSTYTGPFAAMVGWQPSIQDYAANNSAGFTLPSNYSSPSVGLSTPVTGGGLSSLVNSGTPTMATNPLDPYATDAPAVYQPVSSTWNGSRYVPNNPPQIDPGQLNTTPTGTPTMATNPLSQYSVTPTTNSPATPNIGVTAGSSGGSFSQGSALPNITTTQTQATAAPTFYTDYLNQIAQQGGQAAQNAQYVGAQPLQQQAFNQVAQNVGNYQPTLQNAINLAGSVGNTNLAQAVGDVGQANIANYLAPQATAGLVGSGQFGSSRGARALGDTIANAELGITAQQAQAMQQDYANRLAASQQLGSLAGQQQAYGLGDVNALATLGGQQQTIAQNEQLFPMQQLTNMSGLLRGYTMPTSTSSSYTGPIPGAYAASPLQQIAGLGALGAGISNTELGKTLFGTADTIDPKTGAVIKGTPSFLGKGLGSLINGSKDAYDYVFGGPTPKAPVIDFSPEQPVVNLPPELDPGAYESIKE